MWSDIFPAFSLIGLGSLLGACGLDDRQVSVSTAPSLPVGAEGSGASAGGAGASVPGGSMPGGGGAAGNVTQDSGSMGGMPGAPVVCLT
jgi:hypothetical protein